VGVARKVVKQDEPRFYGSPVLDNALTIQQKDSAGTARAVLGLDASNLTKVGPQQAPASGGALVFYANGAEAGRFLANGDMTLEGKLVIDAGLQVTTSAAAGRVLVSDASGNLTLQDPVAASAINSMKWGGV
jgi:hypothetical protein